MLDLPTLADERRKMLNSKFILGLITKQKFPSLAFDILNKTLKVLKFLFTFSKYHPYPRSNAYKLFTKWASDTYVFCHLPMRTPPLMMVIVLIFGLLFYYILFCHYLCSLKLLSWTFYYYNLHCIIYSNVIQGESHIFYNKEKR